MRHFFTISFLLIGTCLLGQSFCATGPGIGVPAGDEPPGCFLCSLAGVYSGSNAGYTPDTTSYIPCAPVENSAWISIFSDTHGAISATILSSNCTIGKGIEVSIFDKDLNNFGCFDFTGAVGNLDISGLEVAEVYHLMFDGIDGDICDFTFILNAPTHFSGFIPNVRTSDLKPMQDVFCVGSEVCFEVSGSIYTTSFEWQIPSNVTVVSGGSLNDTALCVRFDNLGTDSLVFIPKNPCLAGTPIIKQFSVLDTIVSIDTLFQTLDTTFCPGAEVCFYFNRPTNTTDFVWEHPNFFEVLSGGTMKDTFLCGQFNFFGIGTVAVRPIGNCGAAERRVTSLPISTIPIPPIIICNEDLPYQFEDGFYHSFGGHQYVYQTALGCDSIVHFSLISNNQIPVVLDVAVCPKATCVQILDSCYSLLSLQSGSITFERDFPLCDTQFNVILQKEEDLDFVNCIVENESTISFSWRRMVAELVDGFALDVNGQKDTVNHATDQYQISGLHPDSVINFRIQPFGECSFMPFEVSCSISTVTTNDNYLGSRMKIFPNPTTGHLNIETELKINEIEIYNTSGLLLQKEKTTSFELKNHKSGIYFLKIKTNEGVAIKRVLLSLF